MFTFNPKDYPTGPGVYMMHDERGRIIYVGKAKSLVKRLSSYFRGMDRHTPKTRAMVAKVARVQTRPRKRRPCFWRPAASRSTVRATTSSCATTNPMSCFASPRPTNSLA